MNLGFLVFSHCLINNLADVFKWAIKSSSKSVEIRWQNFKIPSNESFKNTDKDFLVNILK
jgi:hypothetical protein